MSLSSLRRPPQAEPLVPSTAAVTFPAIAGRIERAQRLVEPHYLHQDQRAMALQVRFRRVRTARLVVTAVVSVLGVVRAAASDAPWVGVAICLFALAALGLVEIEKRHRLGPEWLSARGKAEALRSLFFRVAGTELGDSDEATAGAVTPIVEGVAP